MGGVRASPFSRAVQGSARATARASPLRSTVPIAAAGAQSDSPGPAPFT